MIQHQADFEFGRRTLSTELCIQSIPRSSNARRIAQNLRVFDFALEAGEMAAINALRARRHRICDFDFSPDWDAA